MITVEQLKQILPYSSDKNRRVYCNLLNVYMNVYDINTPMRVAAFIAQIGHESGSFRYTEEIASGEAYEGRKDLGNTQKGDGVKYKGRGLIQITGRANYTHISNAMDTDFINNPHLLAIPDRAAASACWWWRNRGLNELADREINFQKITKIINGGYNGLADRKEIYKRALKVLVK